MTTELINGALIQYRDNVSDRSIIREARGGWYTKWLHPSSGDIILDIGAHIGSFAVPAARSGAVVIACEPHPLNAALLRRNIELNRSKNVTVYEAAVISSAYARTVTLSSDRPEESGSFSVLHNPELQDGIEVMALPIDQVLRFNPTKVKIDCEGAEYDFIEEVCKTPSVRRIAMEAHVSMIPNGLHRYARMMELIKSSFSEVRAPEVTESRHVMVYAAR